jgi:acyl-CoA reductase-like NAD-dependent aldehyde dehydrogenase
MPGLGMPAGKALALHMDVDGIAFTGSTATGRSIMQYAGQSNMKRVSLECGGKSPNIVMADYEDLDRAARAAAFAIFFNQGEMCSAGSRLLVQADIKDDFLEKVQEVGRTLVPGDPLDPETKLGAIVDEAQMKRVLGYIDSGRREGAGIRMGGKRVREESGGFYVEPTVFDGVHPRMQIAREEIFGPVLATLTFQNEEEAVAVGNSTIYGLAAAVWSRDIKKALRTARALKAGTVWINAYNLYDPGLPFGGYKESGFGRERGRYALEEYTQVKSIWVDLT